MLLIAGIWLSSHSPWLSITGAALVGDTMTRVTIEALNAENNCNIRLYEGWNLIAIACANTSNTSMVNRLVSILPSLLSVHTFDSTDTNDPWKAYKPSLPSYVVMDLSSHSLYKGYWIRTNETIDLNITGTRLVPTFAPFTNGTSLVGYTANVTVNITTAFLNMEGRYNRIRTFNASDGKWYDYLVNGTSNLSAIRPDLGYWVNATESGYVTVLT